MAQNSYPVQPILLVDDELQILTSYKIALQSAGITHLMSCRDSREVIPLLTKIEPAAILLDLTMPYIQGDELLATNLGGVAFVPFTRGQTAPSD